jgi:hypothetical protein
MIGQIMLYLASTIFLLCFFWVLCIALSIVGNLRQSRMERIELQVRPRSSKAATNKHFLVYIHSPLDELQSWHARMIEKPERVPSPLALSMRYHQTLLFADDLGDTHPNPSLSKAS